MSQATARALPPHFAAPWRDRAGRFSRLKTAVLAALFLPGIALFAAWGTIGLGAQPVTRALHVTGQWTVALLLISLALRPGRTLLSWARAMPLRRMVGLAALAYALLHVGLYADQQGWRLGHVVSEIVLRFYLTIGFVAVLGLAVLGITSTDRWQRRLGQRWQRLHRLVYGLAVLGLLHFFLQSKLDVSDATIAAGAFYWLMLWRALPDRFGRSLPAAVVISVAAALLAGVTEYIWYDLMTRVPAARVLAAEETLRFGPRPAAFVLLLGIVALAVIVMRRAWRAPERPASHPALYGIGMAAAALLAWGMGYGGDALPDVPSPTLVSAIAILLAAIAGLARWRLGETRLRTVLDVVWVLALAYPLYTLGLSNLWAGVTACVLLALATLGLAVRTRSLALLPGAAGGVVLAVGLVLGQ